MFQLICWYPHRHCRSSIAQKTIITDVSADILVSHPLMVLVQVLSWLLEAEDHLLSLHSLGQKQLETVSDNDDNTAMI